MEKNAERVVILCIISKELDARIGRLAHKPAEAVAIQADRVGDRCAFRARW